jgi:hypothetical protein
MTVFAEMYIGIDEYWVDHEGLSAYDFNKVATFTPRCPFDEDYYLFTSMDCKVEVPFKDTSPAFPFASIQPEKRTNGAEPDWSNISSVRNVG